MAARQAAATAPVFWVLIGCGTSADWSGGGVSAPDTRLSRRPTAVGQSQRAFVGCRFRPRSIPRVAPVNCRAGSPLVWHYHERQDFRCAKAVAMPEPFAHTVLRYIRTLVAGRQPDGQSDRRLLAAFADQGDEVAFAALMGRHGPMVLGVCWRIVHDEHLAQDAFQATFLVLARQAR